jgi:aminoglycoside phosphotransferase (APT) family kinase protein
VLVPGQTACSAALGDAQRSALAGPLGTFLAALHAFPAADAARYGAGHDTIRRLDLGYRLPKARAALEALARRRLVRDTGPFVAILDAAPGEFIPRSDVLVHGDLYARHLLIDDGRLSGVIDWGDIHLGDPANDLAIAHSFLPPTAHAGFRQAYGLVDAHTWHVARLRALCHSLTVLVYGDEVGDADLVREGHVALGYLSRDQG